MDGARLPFSQILAQNTNFRESRVSLEKINWVLGAQIPKIASPIQHPLAPR